jgi:hypothetical protein
MFSASLGVRFLFSYNTKISIEAERLMPEIYPNPAKSYFAIRLPLTANCTQIKIFDVTGKIVKETKSKNQKTRVSLEGIKNGVYFVKIDNNTQVTKIIVTK